MTTQTLGRVPEVIGLGWLVGREQIVSIGIRPQTASSSRSAEPRRFRFAVSVAGTMSASPVDPGHP